MSGSRLATVRLCRGRPCDMRMGGHAPSKSMMKTRSPARYRGRGIGHQPSSARTTHPVRIGQHARWELRERSVGHIHIAYQYTAAATEFVGQLRQLRLPAATYGRQKMVDDTFGDHTCGRTLDGSLQADFCPMPEDGFLSEDRGSLGVEVEKVGELREPNAGPFASEISYGPAERGIADWIQKTDGVPRRLA